MLIQFYLYFVENDLYISNTNLYFNNSQLACYPLSHVFYFKKQYVSILTFNFFFSNPVICISTPLTYSIVTCYIL